ncbi:MAG: hypothetical protein OXE50_12785, partial [Chloroflexi bacterium]|nr:hypothetical protein [Chloroflexota bacterium]
RSRAPPAAATGEEAHPIRDVGEPYLMQLGFLNRTPRGRMLTRAAYEHLGLTPPTRLAVGQPQLWDSTGQ